MTSTREPILGPCWNREWSNSVPLLITSALGISYGVGPPPQEKVPILTILPILVLSESGELFVQIRKPAASVPLQPN